MARSEQLEREADQARAQLERLVSELRERISLRDVFDRLTDPGEAGAAALISRNMRENPLPLSLMGAGLAWMAVKNLGGDAAAFEETGAEGDGAGRAAFGAGAAERGERLASFVQSEPIILAGLGVAFGALLGAMLPAKEKRTADATVQEAVGALRGEPPSTPAAGGDGAFSAAGAADERRAT